MKRLVLTGVKVGSLAEEMGFQPNDILDTLDGIELTSSEILTEITSKNPGVKLQLVFYRKLDRFEAYIPTTPLGISVAVEDVEQSMGLAKLLEKASGVKLTTAPFFEGNPVIETLAVVSSECVFGMDIISDFLVSLTDEIGGESNTSQQFLKVAKTRVLNGIKIEAATHNADAVIGLDLDYSEFSGSGKSMLLVVATGTAVKLTH